MTTANGDLVVQHTSTATNGDPLTLTTAVAPYRTVADVYPDGSVIDYSIIDGVAGCEACWGIVSNSGGTLSRNTVASTNSNNPLTLSGNAIIRVGGLKRSADAYNALVHALCGGI